MNNAVPDRVRLAPPLVLTEEQAEEFLDALPGILDAAGSPPPWEPAVTRICSATTTSPRPSRPRCWSSPSR